MSSRAATGHVCDGVDKVAAIIEAEDWGSLIGTSLRSRDEVCRCTQPILHGLDLMCACCLHRNKRQEERRLAATQKPHEFEVRIPGDSLDKIGMCSFCSGWRDDPRHQEIVF